MAQTDPLSSTATGRLRSLDVFRGITIALMIIVNNQGDWSHVYPVLKHAAWHGWSGADFVFPFFLFAMGAAVPLSISSKLESGAPKGSLALKILRRTALLLALGIILNLFPRFDFAAMRIPGVLQRIGLCYLLAGLAYLYLPRRGLWILATVILAGYGPLLLFVPPPGSASPALDPGANWCLYLDRLLLAGHTYEHAPVPGFDPEGILSTFPAAVSAMTGLFAVNLLRACMPGGKKIIVLTAAALACTALGLVLNQWLPINKNLWTPSYVLSMAGPALALTALLHWIVDMRGKSSWALPFTVLGANALAAYILSSALGKFLALTPLPGTETPGMASPAIKIIIYRTLYASWLDPYQASLAYALGFLLLWVPVMAIMYRKRIFIRI